jgi:hypothetical protein
MYALYPTEMQHKSIFDRRCVSVEFLLDRMALKVIQDTPKLSQRKAKGSPMDALYPTEMQQKSDSDRRPISVELLSDKMAPKGSQNTPKPSEQRVNGSQMDALYQTEMQHPLPIEDAFLLSFC